MQQRERKTGRYKEKERRKKERKGSNTEDRTRRRGGEKVRAKWRQEACEEAAETHR